jgi:FAD/FMN-containing dehydrogenase
MKRRTFLRSSLAAAAALAVPLPRSAAVLTPVRRGSQPPDVRAVTGDGREVTLTSAMLEELAGQLRGPLLLSGDPGYDEARRILNPSFDRHPALIVQVTGDADVRTAVDFARDHGGLLTAVKCGGHSASGQSTCDRGMMIDLSGLRGVRVDPRARRARVAGGSLLGALDHEAMSHGLVVPMGTVSHTGVGGLVTGGGFGRLARRWGLSIDNLTAVDVVTADGTLRHADAQENQDLFWGVRGGGGNFGVVTSFEFQLHPMARTVVGGVRMYPASRAAEVLDFYAEYAPVCPDELQLDFILTQPPGGAEGAAILGVCWSGPESGAERALAPLSVLGNPMMDGVAAMDYVALQRSGDMDDARAQGEYLKGGFLGEIPPDLIRTVLERFEGAPDRSTTLLCQQGGGAIARVAPSATAFAQRDIMVNMLCLVGWRHGDDPAPHMQWGRSFWEGIEPFTHGFYVNDLELEHSREQIQANYRDNHRRLVEVKTRYDPGNLFRLNANIQPA